MKRDTFFLEDIWGKGPLFKMTKDELLSVKEQYQSFVSEETRIDDITWNDLQLDDIYLEMNACLSNSGDFALYQMLRSPCMDNASLKKRREIMDWAIQHQDECTEVKNVLFDIDKRFQDRMTSVLDEDITQPNRRRITIVLMLIFLLLTASAFLLPIMIFPAAAFFIIGIFRSFYLHKKLEHQMDALVYTVAHIQGLHNLSRLEFSGLTDVKQHIDELSHELKHIHASNALDYFDSDKAMSGFTSYIFQRELMVFDKYTAMIYEKRKTIYEAIRTIGSIDALIGAASYQIQMKAALNITLHERDAHPHMDAKDMYHPMIKKPVCNDIDIHENRLITGSNATGKSSYLKMCAINALFAQCFGFVFAKKYDASFFQIISSMALRDNMFAGESYFMTEIKSLKRMMDKLVDDQPSLCIIDEILRGTNTLERIAASSEILMNFSHKNCIVLGATHDIELTHILEDNYQNYHFKETMKHGTMSFDYKIHKGPSTSRNAIALLSMLGYKDTLVKEASNRLKHFEHEGTWEIIA